MPFFVSVVLFARRLHCRDLMPFDSMVLRCKSRRTPGGLISPPSLASSRTGGAAQLLFAMSFARCLD